MENAQTPEQNPAQPETGAQPGETLQPTPQVPPPPPMPAPAMPNEVPPIPPVPETQIPPETKADAQVTGPALADDVDVIEKEWVDKAAEVVKQTEGDPHAEEEAVEGLQVDYLKKRYGLEIKPDEDK